MKGGCKALKARGCFLDLTEKGLGSMGSVGGINQCLPYHFFGALHLLQFGKWMASTYIRKGTTFFFFAPSWSSYERLCLWRLQWGKSPFMFVLRRVNGLGWLVRGVCPSFERSRFAEFVDGLGALVDDDWFTCIFSSNCGVQHLLFVGSRFGGRANV